ncbi:leucine Rich repeat-containing domain protein, partial [Oesophagostomum dentatum]
LLVLHFRISRRWYRVSRQDILWRNAEFIGDNRLNLRQLTAFIRSPLSAKVVYLSLEGYIVRTVKAYSTSTITNHVLSLMGRKMEKLRSLAIQNANISNVAFKCMPKSLERLCLTGSIIGYCAMDDLAHPGTLPELRELNLDYVHNLSSNSKSFQHILQKKELTHLEVRHCNGISNVDLSRIPDFLVNLQILNLSEIKYLNDPVLKSISRLKNLVELYIAFTLVSDEGVRSLVNTTSKLVRLDIRGCPGVTGISLLTLSEMKSLREVWILRFMNGCAEARKSLSESGSPLVVLDEIDRQKMAIPQRMDFYSIYFANVLANRPSDETVEEMR